MVIDQYPILDSVNKTLTVANLIDTTEDTSIAVNGIICIYDTDFTILDNTITITDDSDINWVDDDFSVYYTILI